MVWATHGPRPLSGPAAPGVFRAPVPTIKQHIAGKPVSVMDGLLTIMDGPILDPFMGSGTVGVACAARGVPYIGIEVVPEYFEIACARLAAAADARGSSGLERSSKSGI